MPSAPAATISPSGATATVLSGVGSVTIVGRAARERPDAQRRVVARGDDRLAVGRERDAVHVVACGLRARAARRRRAATAARCDPMTPTRASRRPAKPRAPPPAPCGLRARATGFGSPGFQIAMRRVLAAGDGAAVAQQRDRIHRAVMEAQHLARRRCAPATSGSPKCRSCRRSPILPSGEIASARTGPPWPRNCACAATAAATSSDERQEQCEREPSSQLYAGNQASAGRMPSARICARTPSSRSAARNACTAGRSRRLSTTQEIVFLRRDRQEPEPVEFRHRRDRDAPVGAALRHRGGDRVVRARLVRVAGRALAAEQLVDQHAGAGAGIAVDHQALRVGERGRRPPRARCGPRSAHRPCGTRSPACAASPSPATGPGRSRCSL